MLLLFRRLKKHKAIEISNLTVLRIIRIASVVACWRAGLVFVLQGSSGRCLG